jgi:formylglycine-generating enzyme required for sulfatase activity
VPEGIVTFGKPDEFPSYGWDNEYGSLKAFVPAFKATKFLISNAEFLDFVKASGYEKRELWTEEGWNWKTYTKSTYPLFWIKDGVKKNTKKKWKILFQIFYSFF